MQAGWRQVEQAQGREFVVGNGHSWLETGCNWDLGHPGNPSSGPHCHVRGLDLQSEDVVVDAAAAAVDEDAPGTHGLECYLDTGNGFDEGLVEVADHSVKSVWGYVESALPLPKGQKA